MIADVPVKQKKTQFSISLSPYAKTLVKLKARKQGVSLSAVIEMLIREALEDSSVPEQK